MSHVRQMARATQRTASVPLHSEPDCGTGEWLPGLRDGCQDIDLAPGAVPDGEHVRPAAGDTQRPDDGPNSGRGATAGRG